MTLPGIDFVVLTGFLGSGKTTLLREYLATEDAGETAIIVNEAGEIGLDGALLREAGGDVAMRMLSNGCVCCEAGTDLTRTAEALLAAPRPDPGRPLRRIVLETSGLSKPGPILRQLAPLAAHRLRLAVVSTFDAGRGPEAGMFEEAAAQWAGAHRIVVTKADTVGPSRFAEAAESAARINPLAEIVALPERGASARAAFAPPSARVGPTFNDPAGWAGPPGAPHPRISTFLLRPTAPLRFADLAAWLDNLAGALGDRLLRLKGLIEVEESDRPLLVQSVGTVFSDPRPFAGTPPGGGPFVVLIGRDVTPGDIEAVLPLLPFRPQSEPGLRLARSSRPGQLRAEAV